MKYLCIGGARAVEVTIRFHDPVYPYKGGGGQDLEDWREEFRPHPHLPI